MQVARPDREIRHEPDADAPACYGPRIAAVIVSLYTGQFLSEERTAQARGPSPPGP